MDQKHLIGSTDDLQKFTRINMSVVKESFLPYETDAREKYLIKYLGDDLHLELIEYYNSENKDAFPSWASDQEGKTIFKQVLFLAQNALAKFTLYLAAPHLDLQLSELGFVVTGMSDNTAPASAERVKNAVQAYLHQGYDNLETLLRFLEKHHHVIASYKDSEAFVLSNRNFINSAEQFDRIVPIAGSRMRFIELKAEMDNIEKFFIEPVISTELSDRIKEQIRGNTLSPPNKTLLDLIRRAVANLVIAETLSGTSIPRYRISGGRITEEKSQGDPSAIFETKERLSGYGKNYLAWIKRTLDKDPDAYPEYKQSAQYVELRSYSGYENTDDPENSLFIFGQP